MRPDEASKDPRVGAVLDGKYHIKRRLGSGGSAVVYEVSHVHLGKRLAVKVLSGGSILDAAAVERFWQEGRLTSRIAHPNVVTATDFGILPGDLPYLVMEYLEGRSLQHALYDHSLRMSEQIRIAIEVCDGLLAVHDSGVVHRDIKPDNIYLAAPNDRPAKILDLGIAELIGPGQSNLTSTGTVCGTPHYMSPEQAVGGDLDPRSDLYSLGVVVYLMLLGQHPFDDDSYIGILTKHLSEPAGWPETLATQRRIPPIARPIVLKALEKNPALRYDNAREFSSALEGIREALISQEAAGRPARTSVPAGSVPPPASTREIRPLPADSSSQLDLRDVIALAPDVHWVSRRDGARLERNSFLRVYRSEGLQVNVIIDPGPPRDLSTLTDKVASVIGNLKNIDVIFFNHQDPDVAQNAGFIQELNPKAHVLCSEDTWRLACYYGLRRGSYSAVEHFPKLMMRMATGHDVSFIPTPFCHFRGAVMYYDHDSRILFSGDLFGGLSDTPKLIADDGDWANVELFHQIYMASNKALRIAIDRIARIDPPPVMIAPQHGGLIAGDLIGRFCRRLYDLEAGLDLYGDERSNVSTVAALNEAIDVVEAELGTDFVSRWLHYFDADGSFPNLFLLDGNRIREIKIESSAAARALLDRLVVEGDAKRTAKLQNTVARLLIDRRVSLVPAAREA